VSNDNKDDWSDDSATLFRGARRAHDPTPVDRAAFDRVLARIQDVAPPPATTGSGRAPYGATVTSLAQIAKVSLAVLGVVGAYFAFGRAEHDSVAAPASAPRASTSAAAPQPVPRVEAQVSATPPPSAEPDGLPPMRVARREDESPIREVPRRVRASTGRRPSSKIDDAIVAEVPSSTLEALSSTPEDSSASAPLRSATDAVAATREPTRRERSLESKVRPAVAPAPDPAIAQPQEPSSELAILKRMQAALRAADFTATLALCAEHQRRWPHGTFELEREGVQAIAACGVSSDGAATLAKAFLAKHPNAAIALRVSSACGKQLKQGR
jgi:hypothetical protein